MRFDCRLSRTCVTSHFPTGRYKQLVNARTQRVNNKPLGYINDLAVASDGTIFFTSSSSKYPPSRYLDIILEAETSGR